MDTTTIIKGGINTITRLSPVALYMGCIVSGIVFNNNKANFVLLGFVMVELISFGYIYINNSITNPQCAMFKSTDKHFGMPAPIPTSIGYFVGFQIADMFERNDFNPGKFYSSIIFLLVIVWSRINVGCHSIVESAFSAVIGLIFGVGYFYLIKDFYLTASETSSTSSSNDGNEQEGSDALFMSL
jgi:hypothetical protein